MLKFEKQAEEKVLSELYRLFELLNKQFYGGELTTPTITISSSKMYSNAINFCQTKKILNDDRSDDAFLYKMTINAELFNRSTDEAISGFMHEMSHLYNLQHGVMDTVAYGIYHNSKFRDVALTHGLCVERDNRRGWAYTHLSEVAKNFINSIHIDEGALRLSFSYTRSDRKNSGKLGNSQKYQCPECGMV